MGLVHLPTFGGFFEVNVGKYIHTSILWGYTVVENTNPSVLGDFGRDTCMGTYPNAAWPNKLGLGTAGTAAAVAPVPFQVKLGEDLGV